MPLASPAFIQELRLKRSEHLLGVRLIQSNVSVVAVRSDRAQMSLDAATQVPGVALESATIAGRHIAERKLRPVFGLDKAIKVKVHFAVYPARNTKRPPVAAFIGMGARRSSERLGRVPLSQSV